MKALTIKQPWLYAITDLDKRIENRTWRPPDFVIGQTIALHASKADDPNGYSAIQKVKRIALPAALPRGAIVATARVVGWLHEDNHFQLGETDPDDIDLSEWFFGPFGWILKDVQKLPQPIPFRGALGLWDVLEAAS